MNSINRLIEVLDIYINDYYKLKEEYRNNTIKQNLYRKLLSFLDRPEEEVENILPLISIIIQEIYNNDTYTYELTHLLKEEKSIREVEQKIYRDFFELKEDAKNILKKLSEIKSNIEIAKNTKFHLKKGIAINGDKNNMKRLREILNYLQTNKIISNQEELLLLNEIEYYNRRLYNKEKQDEIETIYTNQKYQEIPNILNMGFELYDETEVSIERKKDLDNFANQITTSLKQISTEEIIDFIEGYQVYNLENNEYFYIIIKILKYYQEELSDYYEMITEKIIYRNIGDRKETIKNYYQTLDKYLKVRDYYEEITKIEESEEIEAKNQIDPTKQKKLIYSPSTNITKAKIIKDFSDISYEYYEEIVDLLFSFRDGTINPNEIEPLVNHRKLKGKLELKKDQVRIVFKHIKDNIYCIYGVFIKKDDNDQKNYLNQVSRIIPDISNEDKLKKYLELAKHTEEELEQLVKEKSRKSGR